MNEKWLASSINEILKRLGNINEKLDRLLEERAPVVMEVGEITEKAFRDAEEHVKGVTKGSERAKKNANTTKPTPAE